MHILPNVGGGLGMVSMCKVFGNNDIKATLFKDNSNKYE
jgi:hypothetical protein